MRRYILQLLLILFILASFVPQLHAQNRRTVPLDLYLIIDGTESFREQRNDAISWLNGQVVGRLLMAGDRVTIWNAGNTAELVFSGLISGSGEIREIQDKLSNLSLSGRRADFSGALRDVLSRVSQTPADRISHTMLITSSALGLEAALSGSYTELLRWSRSERHERWQALVVAPHIGPRVRQAALGYMNSIQQR